MRVLYCFYGIASMPMGVSLDFSLFFHFHIFSFLLWYTWNSVREFGGGVEAGTGGTENGRLLFSFL